MNAPVEVYTPQNNIRVITATSLFDGHDASTNIIRRILQDSGVEVIHLAHNRSVEELVNTAIEEDAQGIAMSSYQGGHVEAFKYMVDLLKEKNASHIKIFGGGGGVIIHEEIKELMEYGVTKIYSPEDGASMGLQGMINDMLALLDFSTLPYHTLTPTDLQPTMTNEISGLMTAVQEAKNSNQATLDEIMDAITPLAKQKRPPVVGITGTGGAGKSSLTDELIVRFLYDTEDTRIAVICCDPSRRKTGGALLGDRIRMNSISTTDRVYMRSLATRDSAFEVSEALPESIEVAKAAGFDLIIAETAGIGQGDSRITDLSDVSIYVMTSEFGAPSQLEKIDMLDYADLIVINKFEKKGSDDALRDVRKQVQRNRKEFGTAPEQLPVYGTIASKFNDDGVTALYHAILDALRAKTSFSLESTLPRSEAKVSSSKAIVVPAQRIRYLAEIAEAIRGYHSISEQQAEAIRRRWHLEETIDLVAPKNDSHILMPLLEAEKEAAAAAIDGKTDALLSSWKKIRHSYSGDEYVYTVRDKEIRVPLYSETLSHSRIPKICLPKFSDPGEIYRWMRRENLPGFFPYSAGVFPLKRVAEDPTRMFAGEGGPKETNARFKMLSFESEAKRLSTAFDSVTLYGWDPALRPDIYGKIGTSGVSICTLDDVKQLYDGFELCSPTTSVSMTINGPAPIMLAMFMNTAIDQQVDKFTADKGRAPGDSEYNEIKTMVFNNVRGTIQADILKEDQGQNTCIFSIEFALKMMGDIQQFFIDNNVRNFYSVSVSGYHIAEAGANPITQLALTLSNGFTYVEYYLARGMDIDQIAPRLSFFFSNGMDPEYTVIGRVARRIWAVAMREKYGASEDSCKLKYHIQTSGRSLHSQDIQFNDIRTTLQGLIAVYDNCNSLHTNAYDEAITTPSSESVRRALAIQLIINREWGLSKNENMNQGSFIIEELTDMVEEAVLIEFARITERGGVLGAMETGYQRSKIQEESLYYEHLKHTGEHPIVGVNIFRNPDANFDEANAGVELARATDDIKQDQLNRLAAFQEAHKDHAPQALENLKKAALQGDNLFAELLETVKSCSLGQITNALYEVGGQYRRNM
ncbi:MAG: fused isobutyryl-CoA mutase/GTPase IcmF [Desulfopila sp.]